MKSNYPLIVRDFCFDGFVLCDATDEIALERNVLEDPLEDGFLRHLLEVGLPGAGVIRLAVPLGVRLAW